MNKEKILKKLTELFLSKNKAMLVEVGHILIQKLCEKFQEKEIINGIELMIWDEDDFPTLGKIAEKINEYIDKNKDQLLHVLQGQYGLDNTDKIQKAYKIAKEKNWDAADIASNPFEIMKLIPR